MQHLQKTWGWVFLPILEKSARSRRRELAFPSSSFLSHSSALFGTVQNSTPLFSMASALFASKHPGGSKVRFVRRKLKSIVVGRTHGTACSAKESSSPFGARHSLGRDNSPRWRRQSFYGPLTCTYTEPNMPR